MKYAYIMGSAAFIVPSRVIGYDDNGEDQQFLRINSIHRNLPPTAENALLNIDLNITDTDGNTVILLDNKMVNYSHHAVNIQPNSIEILKPDGTMVIKVLQLFDADAMALEHNIVAELAVNDPVTVIRIIGEFMLGNLHIRAENEKLLINETGYATSAMTGQNQLKFTEGGVVL